MSETVKSFCRVCHAFCGYDVTVEDGRITRLQGDKTDPVSLGYACFKGLRSAEFYNDEKRVKRPLMRRDGELVEVSSEEALTRAGERLKQILAESGPEALGFFVGTQAYFNALSYPTINAFASAVGTPKIFTTMTIDQSAKWIAPARMGEWKAGALPFEEADVWMIAGANPMTTMVGAAGSTYFAFSHPVEKMKRAKERGMKLVVIDPRQSETAAMADIHLQIIPGRDPEVAAALLHVILAEGWHDHEFCDQYVNGLEAMRQAVAPFSPEAVAPVAGVSAEQIRAAAAMFARDGRRGMVGTGSGPDMARFSNTAEHLYQAINVVCGRFPRPGDRVANAGVLRPPFEMSADVTPPTREWERGPKTAANGLGTIRGTMMSAEISNEIMHPGEGRLRALIVVGGNPQVALPDQAFAEKALSSIDLLVVIDPNLSGTARLADYIIGPKLPYERADHSLYLERNFQVPFSHYTPAVVPPPEGSDVVDDWYALWRIAQAAGISLQFAGEPLAAPGSQQAPTSEELLARLVKGSRVPLEQVKAAGQGALFDNELRVSPRSSDARFEVMPEDVAAEVGQVAQQMQGSAIIASSAGNEFQAVVRRHKDMMNSTGTYFPSVIRRYGTNPIYMNPNDMARLGLAEGDEVLVSSSGDREIGGRLKSDRRLREGVISISHGWSGRASHPLEATNRLIDPDEGKATINHMPILTGYAVTVTRAAS